MRNILVLGLTVLAPNLASATTCWPEGGERAQVRKAFDASSAVFSAYVLETTQQAQEPRAKVSVLQVWKGELAIGQIVETTAAESVTFVSDGVVASPGTALLVYSSSAEPYLLHTCSRTRVLDDATGDIPLLNKLSRKRRYELGS